MPAERILVLTTTLPGVPGDGRPEFVLSLARALGKEYDITIIAPRVPGAPERLTIENVRIKRFRYFPRRLERLADGGILPNLRAEPWRIVEIPPLLISLWWRTFVEARAIRPSLLHAHWILPAGFVALMIKRMLGIPYLLTVHGGDAFALGGPVFATLKRWIVREAAVTLPVSREVARALGMRSDEDDLVIPMGVDGDAIRHEVGGRTPVPGQLLFVGRLVEKKGLDVLLRALARTPDVRAVIVGDGPNEIALRDLANDLGISERTHLVGRQPRAKVIDELKRAHAMVIPSKRARDGDRDGTPVVMAEAMAAGVPIIASDLGGLGEHIDDGRSGILVRPGSVDELMSAIRTIIDADPLKLAEMAENARRHLAESLDIKETSRRYREVIRSRVVESIR